MWYRFEKSEIISYLNYIKRENLKIWFEKVFCYQFWEERKKKRDDLKENKYTNKHARCRVWENKNDLLKHRYLNPRIHYCTCSRLQIKYYQNKSDNPNTSVRHNCRVYIKLIIINIILLTRNKNTSKLFYTNIETIKISLMVDGSTNIMVDCKIKNCLF